MTRRFKTILAILILAATAAAFIYYFVHHPETFDKLGDIPTLNLVAIFLIYICFNGSIALILLATVKLCNVTIKTRDGVLLTMWSSIINFFGPLQSGPAFRALYLKKVHNISLKNYGLATLLYYGFYAAFSGLFLLSGVIAWPLLLVLAFLGLIAGYFALRLPIKLMQRLRALPLNQIYSLALATLLQVVLITIIYVIELKSINSAITIHQAIIYAGAANFALFVSITPGAIGFREAFLIFSQNLHHISPSTIIAANVIDRAAYILLLGVLFIAAISIHAKDRLLAEAKTT
jgi:uncharacterized membrane protein YbhN (UPF0104 family)